MKITTVVLVSLFLGGCLSFLDTLPSPLYTAEQLPGVYNTVHTAVGDGICTALNKLFGGC